MSSKSINQSLSSEELDKVDETNMLDAKDAKDSKKAHRRRDSFNAGAAEAIAKSAANRNAAVVEYFKAGVKPEEEKQLVAEVTSAPSPGSCL